MPASEINDRPTTFRSGTTLQPRYSVQHRSDILLVEQTETVKNSQNTLLQILGDLENAKTNDELEQLRAEAQAARDKADSAILVLQILYKIDSELSHARKDLEDALEHDNGDIMAARKRVMWLEDRMGALCGKVRLRGQPQRQGHRNRGSEEAGGLTFRSGMSDNDDLSEDPRHRVLPPIRSGTLDSDADRGYNTPSLSGSEDYHHLQQRQGLADTTTDTDTPTTRSASVNKRADTVTSVATAKSLQVDKAQEQGSERSSAPGQGSEDNDQLTQLPLHFQKHEFTPRSTSDQSSVMTQEKTVEDEEFRSRSGTSSESSGSGSSDSQESSESEEEDKTVEEGEDEEEEDKEEDQEEEEGEEREEEKTVEENEEGSSSEAGDKVGEMTEKQDEKRVHTFITEVSVATNKSRVTIVTPKREDTRQAFLREVCEEEHDLILEYWKSEHHRFEYGDYSDVLCQLDPLSYHQMGLAVPGTFLPKPEREFKALPWHIQSKKGTDIMDIHKIALDKLAMRIHNMYDKVYQAAMLSVDVTKKQKGKRETSLLQSTLASKEGTTVSSSTLPAKSMVSELSRPQTMAEQKTEKKLMSSPKTVHMVYYPKPIPPPEALPLTRTTAGKEFPRPAHMFADPDPAKRKPAVRIVNQRNLAQETKLTLYRERTRAGFKGPSSTEKKFRLMLEQDKSADSSRKSTATKPTYSRALTKISNDFDEDFDDFKSETLYDDEGSLWSKIKPKNKNREYSGLKWERVKSLVHTNLMSDRADERIDAAKHLGLLRCGDTMVFFALKERMKSDEDQRVRYEAAKSLIYIGCWEEEVLQVILKYLAIGNKEIRMDLIRSMVEGKNVQYVNKSISVFPELVKMLSHFCRNPDPYDSIALDSAILLGKLCVADENAKIKLKRSLEYTTDTHVKAKSLEILVRQLNCTDLDIVKSITDMLNSSYVWKYRALAAQLLITLGPKNVLKGGHDERIYEILERRLWDEPCSPVRLAAAKALTALGLFGKACEKIEKRLEHTEEDIRAQAVISVGTLGMKNEKTIRSLLEMFELDSSDYVRLMIVRTFMALNTTDKRVIRALKEKEKADGILARESRKALKSLESLRELSTPIGRKTTTPHAKQNAFSSQQNYPAVTQSA